MGRNLGPLNIKDSYEGLVQISGSDQLTDGSGSLIPLLDVTASAANQVSASIDDAALPRRVMFRDTAAGYDEVLTNDGLLFTPSTGILQTTSSFAVSADNALTATSASYATTASFAESSSADDLTLQQVTDNGAATTNDISINGRIYGVAGISSPTAGGNYIVRGGTVTAGLQLQGNDNTATNSILLNTNGVQISGSLGIQDDITIAGDLTGLASSVNVNNITASFASFTSASIGSLRTVTGSAVIIGDEFIILNADTPTARYAGLIVYDSGSGTPATASFEWDGLSDNWIIVEESGNSGVVLTGPTGSKGSEVEPTVNTLQKGGGHHQLIDSSISDDGTLVTIDANVSASGYVSASAFIGDGSQLTGIATTPTLQDVLDNGNTATEDMTLNGVLHVGDGVSSRVINIANVGFSNTPSTDGNSFGSVIIGRDNVSGKGASISIGRNNNNRTLGNGQDNFVIGRDNGVNGNFTGANVIFGYGLQISGDGNYRAMIGGESNTSTAGSHNALLGGSSNTTSHARSAIIGGTGLATTKADEVVVKHLSIYGDTLVDDGTNTGTLLNNVGQSAVSSEDAVNTVIHLTQAEYDALTPDANTLYVIEGAETLGDTEIDGQLTGAVNTISDSGGTTALDCSVGNYFTLAMPAGGTTVLTPSNITAGQTINIKITQNASAATLTYASTIDFPGGTAFTISTGSGEVDILTLVSFDGTTLQATGLANFS